MKPEYFENLFTNPDIDVASKLSVYEASDLVGKGDVINQPGTTPVAAAELRNIVNAYEWLPWAAEVYDISPNIRDYIIVPVEIIVSDLPNKNGMAFPGEELLRFLPEHGTQSYRTWIGKPTCLEHKNRIANGDPAKGVILSTAMRLMTTSTSPYYRLMHLLSFDRNKDSTLANQILKRERTGYSMGSSCGTYTCSICKADMRKRPYCEHINVTTPEQKYKSLKLFGSQLAFPQSRYTVGIECSSVNNPAGQFAYNPNLLIS